MKKCIRKKEYRKVELIFLLCIHEIRANFKDHVTKIWDQWRMEIDFLWEINLIHSWNKFVCFSILPINRGKPLSKALEEWREPVWGKFLSLFSILIWYDFNNIILYIPTIDKALEGKTILGGNNVVNLFDFNNNGLGIIDVLFTSIDTGSGCGIFFESIEEEAKERNEGGNIAGVINISKTEGGFTPTILFTAFHIPALRGTSSPKINIESVFLLSVSDGN